LDGSFERPIVTIEDGDAAALAAGAAVVAGAAVAAGEADGAWLVQPARMTASTPKRESRGFRRPMTPSPENELIYIVL
jgi:hypothetical protein